MSFPLFQRPGTVVFLDDDPDYLEMLALVLDADPWFVSLAIQAESFIKCPICLWRIRSRKWIHDVTLPEGER